MSVWKLLWNRSQPRTKDAYPLERMSEYPTVVCSIFIVTHCSGKQTSKQKAWKERLACLNVPYKSIRILELFQSILHNKLPCVL